MFTLLLTRALAADEPGLWLRQAVGFGGWPSGAVSDTRLQYRAPLHRSESIVFRDTYAGVGGRLAVTPAVVSRDRSMVLGGVLMTRPLVKKWAPELVLQVLPYLRDPDRVGGVPNIQGQVFWIFD